MKEITTAKRTAQRRLNTIKALEWAGKRLAKGREEMHIGKFTLADVETALSAQASPWSRASLLSRLSTIFNFAVRLPYFVIGSCRLS